MNAEPFYIESTQPRDYTEYQIRRFVLPITTPYMAAYGITVLVVYLTIILTQGLPDTDDSIGLVATFLATTIPTFAWFRRLSLNPHHFFPLSAAWHGSMGVALGCLGNDDRDWALYALGLACIICATGSPSWLTFGQLSSVVVLLLVPCIIPLIWNIGWERDLMSVAFFVVPTLAVSTTLHVVADREFRRSWHMAKQLAHLATHDTHTQLLNHHQWHTEISRLLTRQVRSQPNTIIFMDADHFKQINDEYGHATGDRVLAGLGEIIRTTVEPDVVCGRLGGEEFALFYPGGDEADAIELARRISAAIADNARGDLPLPSMSMGIALLQPNETLEQAVNRADQAMLLVKRTGRGGILTASDTD